MFKIILRTTSLITLAFLFVWMLGFLWFVEKINMPVDNSNVYTDAIVVLTGGKGRLSEGFTLLKNNKSHKMFISGVGEKATIHDLQMLSNEVLPNINSNLSEKVVLGHKALNTKGNAKETSNWAGLNEYRSIILVTSSYHMPRSLIEFKAAMPNVIIYPHPVFNESLKLSEWWKSPGTTKVILTEYNKYLVIWLQYKAKLLNLRRL